MALGLPTLTERRDAIADALRTELAEHSITVYARWPDQIVLPALIVWPTSENGPLVFEGESVINVDLVLLVASEDQDNVRAQEKLDEFLSGRGPNAIRGAADAYPELRMAVGGWQDYGLQELAAGTNFWGCRFGVELY